MHWNFSFVKQVTNFLYRCAKNKLIKILLTPFLPPGSQKIWATQKIEPQDAILWVGSQQQHTVSVIYHRFISEQYENNESSCWLQGAAELFI